MVSFVMFRRDFAVAAKEFWRCHFYTTLLVLLAKMFQPNNDDANDNNNNVEEEEEEEEEEADDWFSFLMGPTLKQATTWSKEKLLERGGGPSVGFCNCTRLHHALNGGAAAGVLRVLIERAPEALNLRNEKGSVPLIQLDRSTDTNIAMLMIQKTPEEGINNINKKGITNIASAIKGKASPYVLLALMRRTHDILFAVKDQEGKLAIHHAAASGCSHEVTQEILRRSPPDALSTLDKNGSIPLDYALSTHHQDNVQDPSSTNQTAYHRQESRQLEVRCQRCRPP